MSMIVRMGSLCRVDLVPGFSGLVRLLPMVHSRLMLRTTLNPQNLIVGKRKRGVLWCRRRGMLARTGHCVLAWGRHR